MNTADIATLITAITGTIGAVTALIISVRHIINHDSSATDKPVDSQQGATPKPNIRRGSWE